MKKRLVLLPLIAVCLYTILTSNAGGPGGDYTAGGCSCHGASASTTSVSVQLLNSVTLTPVTTYVAGNSYVIRVTGTQTSGAFTLPRFGFQVAAVQTSSPGTSAGTLTPVALSRLITPGVNVIEHTTALTATSGGGGVGTTYVRDIPWAAPTAGFGGVTLRGVINAVDYTFSTANDKWNTANAGVQELGAITGTATVCVGGSTTLSNTFAGGVWNSASTGIATVTTAGVVSGVAAGTAVISYTGGGNTVTRVVTVNASPAAIGGTLTVCAGQNTTLTNSVSGGAWTSSATAVGTVGATSGIVTGLSAGTTNITYTVGTCSVSATVTVNGVTPITGTTSVCLGNTTALANATAGGTWSSSNTAVGTVSTSGVVSGLTTGTTNITYILPSSCAAVTTVTVNAVPATIGGTLQVCIGGSTTATNTVSGGAWTTGSGNISIGSGTGVITPISVGTAGITYTLAGGCTATAVVTVNPLPTAIAGSLQICNGSSSTLASTPAGGTWTSSNTSIANIGATTGVVAGIAIGTSTISYTLSTGCARTAVVTVNALPGAITGALTLCNNGSTTALSSSSAGGTWSSSSTGVATVGSGTGVATAVGVGTTTISYTLPTGCRTTNVLTINPQPNITSGATSVCVGASATIAATPVGGTYTSSNTAVATVNSSTGLVSGVATGTAVISYALSTGCVTTTIVTVNNVPAAITGATTLCTGTNTTYTSATAGGTWASGSTGVLTINSTTGVATGVAAGTATITYTVGTGCSVTNTVTVDASPAGITGALGVCVGGVTTTLSSATPGGTWSSSNTAVATMNSSTGELTSVAVGTTTVSYLLSTGCVATAVATVNPLPAAIAGSLVVCDNGSTVPFTNSITGGTWGCLHPSVASINATTGVATPLTAGTATITYTLATGCSVSAVLTVNVQPTLSVVSSTLCVGSTGSLTGAPAGGTFSSSNTSIVTVSGVLGGISAGTAAITYALSNGCATTRVITVNPLPAAVVGPTTICESSTAAYSNSTSGGTWSSSNTSVVTINSSGVATALTTGTSTIIYTLGTGCARSMVVTVNPLPAAITGTTSVCTGATTTLNSASTGGTWASSSVTVATVGSSTGVVTGVAAGLATITYTLSTGCARTTGVTVNTTPPTIGGTASVCVGSTTALTNAAAGGAWSSSNTGVATINSTTGVATGVAAGTATISYTLSTGCFRTAVILVNALPGAITGSATTCVGTTSTLTNPTAGGTWSSTSAAIATIGSGTGVMTGVAIGTTVITYRLATGCISTIVATITPAPTAGAISGSSSLCTGLSTTLTSPVAGGTWSSSTPAVATVGTGGVVTGVLAGTTTITYTVNTSCGTVFSTKDITVTTSATSGTITGTSSVCVGQTTTLSSTVLGGTWTSSNTTVATVGSSTGVVAGLTAGTSRITYTITSSCGTATTTNVVTVNPLPAAPTGPTNVCVNASITLTGVGGGTFSGSDDAIALVSSGGVVTGVSAGTVIVTYTLGTGCISTRSVTVLPIPAVIGGSLAICAGSTTTLTNATSGGTWSSGSTSIATIGSGTGLVSAFLPGNTVINYTLTSTGCARSATLTVNPNPATITGTASVCLGSTTTLANTSAGGTWTSSNATIASIDGATGVVTGNSAGTATVTYTLPTSCRRTATVTVNALPTAISGTPSACIGSTTTLSSTPTGGTWASSDVAIATIGSSTGVATGIAAGTANITYTSAAGCRRTTMMTVNPLPDAVTGMLSACLGGSTTLSSATTGGVWSSGNTAVATVDIITGVVSTVSAGTAVMTYTLPTGCITTAIMTVNPLPSVISGTLAVCVGNTRTLGSTPAGGTWTSSNTTVGTIAATGVITGISAGTTTVSYELSTGCVRTGVVTVNPLPATITGTAQVCVGSTTALSNVTPSGTWTSNNTATATIGLTTGSVVGVSTGTVFMTYTIPTGCVTTTIVTVNTTPAAITGLSSVCVGSGITLSTTTTGGTWTSSAAATAIVGSASGIVTGVSAGTVTISYVMPTGCFSTKNVTVNPLPVAGTIAGPTSVCVVATATLTPTITGGVWSFTTGKISITAGGVITGVVAGNDTAVYSVTNVCGTAVTRYPVVVNPLPDAGTISGSTDLCDGGTTVLASTGGTGSWTSSNATVATVSGTGIVLGMTPGTAKIVFTVTNVCGTDKDSVVLTVYPLVDAGVIAGNDTVCVGFTTTLTNAVAGGVWSSTAAAVATVSAAGVVNGVTPGTATIRYIVNNVCSADTATFVITVMPAAFCSTKVLPEASGVSFNLYPNPTNGSLNIESGVDGKLTIYTIDGKMIETINIIQPVTATLLPAHLSTGVYMCRFVGADGSSAVVRLVYGH